MGACACFSHCQRHARRINPPNAVRARPRAALALRLAPRRGALRCGSSCLLGAVVSRDSASRRTGARSPAAGSILNAAAQRGDPMKHEAAVREHRPARTPPTPITSSIAASSAARAAHASSFV